MITVLIMEYIHRISSRFKWSFFVAMATIVAAQSADKARIPVHNGDSSALMGSPDAAYSFSNSGDKNIEIMRDILSSLEKLDIISAGTKRCFFIENIVKVKTSSSTNDHMWKIGINLYVKEINNGKGRPVGGSTDIHTGSEPQNSKTDSGKLLQCDRNQDIENTQNDIPMDINLNINISKENNSMGENSPNYKHDDSSSNSSAVHTGEVTRTKAVQENAGSHVSTTQVLVISTCSVIIGIFVILVVLLRIRSYLKRTRIEQEIARRPTFRSCSVALRSNQNSLGGSNAGLKTSDDLHIDMNEDDDYDIEETQTKSSYQDIRPLLVVTSCSAPPSPSPIRTDFDYQNESDEKQISSKPPIKRNASAGDEYIPPRCQIPLIKPTVIIEDTDAIARGEGVTLYMTSDPPEVLPPCVGKPTVITAPPTANQERLLEFGIHPEKRGTDGEVVCETKSKVERPKVLAKLQRQAPQEVSIESEIHSPNDSELGDENGLGSTGLTQSDSSISSSNPSYRYGNQSEYTSSNTYGNNAYSPGDISTDFPTGPVSFQNPVYMTSPEELKSTARQNGSVHHSVDEDSGNCMSSDFDDVENTAMNKEDSTCVTNQIQENPETRRDAFAQYDNDSFTDTEGDLNRNIVTQETNDSDIYSLSEDAQNTHGCNSSPNAQKNDNKKVGFSLDIQDRYCPEESDIDPEESDLEENALLGDSNNSPQGNCDERSFLLGPEFEGMQPTYV